MRLLISAAAALALSVALLSACKPHDTSGPASNSSTSNATASGARATDATPTNSTTAQAPLNVPASAQQTPAPTDDVARIKQDELIAAMKKGSVVVYDVRDKAAYAAGHIKGAKNVPWGEVEQRLAEFPKDKRIVTYCA